MKALELHKEINVILNVTWYVIFSGKFMSCLSLQLYQQYYLYNLATLIL
jgi:hypothetical protein